MEWQPGFIFYVRDPNQTLETTTSANNTADAVADPTAANATTRRVNTRPNYASLGLVLLGLVLTLLAIISTELRTNLGTPELTSDDGTVLKIGLWCIAALTTRGAQLLAQGSARTRAQGASEDEVMEQVRMVASALRTGPVRTPTKMGFVSMITYDYYVPNRPPVTCAPVNYLPGASTSQPEEGTVGQ